MVVRVPAWNVSYRASRGCAKLSDFTRYKKSEKDEDECGGVVE